jgi:hypothetical protein
MVNENDKPMSNDEISHHLERLFYKTQEIYAIMKKGEFIPAHEKLGGVIKNINTLRSEMVRRNRPTNAAE